MGDLLGLEGHQFLRLFPFRLPVLFAASQIVRHGPERRVGRIHSLIRVGSGLARLGRLLPYPLDLVPDRSSFFLNIDVMSFRCARLGELCSRRLERSRP